MGCPIRYFWRLLSEGSELMVCAARDVPRVQYIGNSIATTYVCLLAANREGASPLTLRMC